MIILSPKREYILGGHILSSKVSAMYFSGTGTTKKVVSSIADTLYAKFRTDTSIQTIDFTLPNARQETVSFTEEQVVIIGIPVYRGRVPKVLLQYLNSMNGNGASAIAVVVYGNRDYDDALAELTDILASRAFKIIAGGAFIGEHSFSQKLAQNRPDEKDMIIVEEFANKVVAKLLSKESSVPIVVKGNRPYRTLTLKNANGKPTDLEEAIPKTANSCIDCKACAKKCPMESISEEDVKKVTGICIKCGACVKNCPMQAKYYDNEEYLRHVRMLETKFALRREPEFFV
jgi:Fe-S-cluster-containing hydrogenase components 2